MIRSAVPATRTSWVTMIMVMPGRSARSRANRSRTRSTDRSSRLVDPFPRLASDAACAENIAHAGTHVLECVHTEHALGGDDAEIFGHGAALNPRGGRTSMSVFGISTTGCATGCAR